MTSDSTRLWKLGLSVLQPGFTGLTPPTWLLRRLEDGLGGVVLFSRNVHTSEQVADLTTRVHAVYPNALVAIDEEGGDVTRLEHATGSSWPGNLALGVVDDVALTEQVAAGIGASLAAVGIDLDYAPDADVNVDASNPVIGVRSFGDDPELVARHTAAWVRGLQGAGVLACAKHFPGHGDTDVDSHHEPPEIEIGDPATSPWLAPFRAAVEAGVAAVMSAHVRVPELDPRPATLAPAVMTGLLRDELGFTGLTLSDGLEMGAVARTTGLVEGAVQSIAAGVDALCIGGGLADEQTVDALVAGLVAAVLEGRLSERRLADASARVDAAAALRREWRSRVRRDGADPREAGLVAARRALRWSGELPAVESVPVLVELTAPFNIAVGDITPHGVATAAGARWPGLRTVRLGPDDDLGPALAAAEGAPLWLVVRDPHRFAWMEQTVHRIGTARPDAVVIDTGWPGWEPSGRLTHVVTHGASWACGQAVVELLAPAPVPLAGA